MQHLVPPPAGAEHPSLVFSRMTSQLARTFALAPEQGLLDSLFGLTQPEFTEWSVNQDGDPRGVLRVALRPAQHARVRDALMHLPYPFARSLYLENANDIIEAYLGVAHSAQGTTLRLWAAPLPSRCQAFVERALRAEPALAESVRWLAARCGGVAACEGFGVEGRGAQPSRWTIYFPVPERSTAEHLLEYIGGGASACRDFFLKALLGIEARRARFFPKVWIGRSVGASCGWKLYYFARHDRHRLSDGVLLDLMDASPAVRQTWQMLGSYAQPAVRRAGLIHLVGLTIPDSPRDAEPRLTIYFALDRADLAG